MPAELIALREQIDALDQQLFVLLAERFQVTAQVGELKKTIPTSGARLGTRIGAIAKNTAFGERNLP
ncbi:chorismate mutase [Deefgea sp. CFH1-16]|uniref:chorismate mutase n=1 Tax=Deefgea sp. CFH1-16 TaxID=2675457 RepID=UPI00194035A6|nr:chorismate mutase [Deefgea sp. CFH1-16]